MGGGGISLTEPEVPEDVPAEVQAFLDAVAGIPEITPDNAAEAAEYIYGPVTEAYQALLDTDFMDRDNVKEAEAVYAAAIEAVEEALALASETFVRPPAKPTDDTLKALKLGVKIMCDMEGSGHHAELCSTLTTSAGTYAKTVGEVTANSGDNKNQYPYTCTVSISTEQQRNFWHDRYQKQVGGDVNHKLLDNAQDLSVTLYWNGTTWVELGAPAGWHYMEIHMRHVINPSGLEFTEQINGIEPNRQFNDIWWVSLPGLANGAELNYTLTVTNNTNVDLKDLLIRDRRDNADKVKLVEGSARVTVNGVERNFTCTKTAYSAYYYWKIEGNIGVGDVVVLTYKAVMPHEGGGPSQPSAANYVLVFAKLANGADIDADFLSNNPSIRPFNNPFYNSPDGYTKENAIANQEIRIGMSAHWLDKPTRDDLQQVSVIIKCKDNSGHDSGTDWWKLGYTLDGTDKVSWRDTWRSIGNVTYNDDDDTYQSIVTFYATKWADMRIEGDTLTNIKNSTGIRHAYYGTTLENGSDKAKPGGENLETVPVKFVYKDGKWTTDTESVTVWLKETNTVTLRYMCDVNNAPFSSGNYSYGLDAGRYYNHSVDNNKTGFPQVKDFGRDYRSPKSFKITPSSANTWAYDEVMTTDALAGAMGDGNIVLDVWYSKDNRGVIMRDGADSSDGIPDKYQAKVTFRVVNGAWGDGSTADVVKYVIKYGTDGTTMAKDGTAFLGSIIPAVGDAGSWDVKPTAASVISRDTVYTYDCRQPETHTVTVRYMCSENNMVFCDADYSYRLAKGEKYDHSIDSNKTGFPDITGFDRDYMSPKSFRIDSIWSYDASRTDASRLAGTMGDEDIVIEVWYCREKPASYTVSFNSNGGSPVPAQTVEDGKAASRPADPVREDYTFGGWTLDGGAYDFSKAVTGDITLEAQWSQNSSGTTPEPVTPMPGPDTKPEAGPGTKPDTKPTAVPETKPSPEPEAKTTEAYSPLSEIIKTGENSFLLLSFTGLTTFAGGGFIFLTKTLRGRKALKKILEQLKRLRRK